MRLVGRHRDVCCEVTEWRRACSLRPHVGRSVGHRKRHLGHHRVPSESSPRSNCRLLPSPNHGWTGPSPDPPPRSPPGGRHSRPRPPPERVMRGDGVAHSSRPTGHNAGRSVRHRKRHLGHHACPANPHRGPTAGCYRAQPWLHGSVTGPTSVVASRRAQLGSEAATATFAAR
jgi:hypothetical protein